VRVIVGGQYYPTIEGSSVQISHSATDPVPTCAVNFRDNSSVLNIIAPQEMIIIDDQVIPNPTQNMLLNPSMLPYNTSWTTSSPTGITLSQNGGGGLIATVSNMAVGTSVVSTQNSTIIPWYPVAGQSYIFSCYVQGSGTINQVDAQIGIQWFDLAGNSITSITFSAVPGALTRYTVTQVAPANVGYVQAKLSVFSVSNTNSAVVTFTQAQLEPVWFPTLAYPTPWCGPSQTNCQQLPLGYYIRQYRKFGGFVNNVQPQNYHGNVRTIQVSASGYAWLLDTIIGNDTFTSRTDAQVISTLLGKYLLSNGVAMATTTNVVTGVTVSSVQLNWDTLRTAFDSLASLSTFFWTIDEYWNMVYAPAGYVSMPIQLICDITSTPDLVTTFPAYGFQSQSDFTQPGSNIIVLGNGSNTAQVIDPSRVAQLSIISGYQLPSTTSWMRKITESTLASVADCTQRGMAELILYDFARGIFQLKTNVELLAGQGIRVSSNTDGLYQTMLLIQQVSAQWIGTSETLTDTWEYSANLGAVNRVASHMISRLFRLASSGTAATAISSTTLALLETVGVTDTIDSNSLYAEAILASGPKAYYRLGEPAGFGITTIYDWSGGINTGNIVGTVTFGQPGAIYNDSNTAALFDGATGYCTLQTPLNGNGTNLLALIGWFNLSTTALGSTSMMIASGTTAAHTGYQLYWSSTTSLNVTIGNGTTTATATYTTSPVAGTYQFIAATYDGSNVKLFVNIGTVVTQVAITAFSGGTISASATPVLGGDTSHGSLYPGTIDEMSVFYVVPGIALLQQYYNLGTVGHV
jgi:hypothetical protein